MMRLLHAAVSPGLSRLRALRIVLGAALIVVLAAACTAQQSGLASRRSSAARPSDARSTSPRSTGDRSTGANRARAISAVPRRMDGRLITRVIPGNASAFRARPAFIYLPPILRWAPHTRLPVLMLLHGIPGGPSDWVQKGAVARTMNAFAAAHGGRAPIVVMPDINGSLRTDTECVNGPLGHVETYLTRDVPAYLRAHLPVTPPGRHWGIAGLSEGATCSLMLGIRHPGLFSTIGFFSGMARPTVGNTDDPAATTAQLFGGSASAYRHHDPLWLMRHGTYRSLGVWLECGSGDQEGKAGLALVSAAARPAGMSTQVQLTAGNHHWPVWQTSLKQYLPWLWGRIRPA